MTRQLKDVTARTEDLFSAENVTSYRTGGPKERGRVAVEMDVRNRGEVAWTPSRAALLGAKGEELTGLTVEPQEPIPPGKWLHVVVELEMAEDVARGTFTLKLWAGEAGARSVNFDGVTFP